MPLNKGRLTYVNDMTTKDNNVFVFISITWYYVHDKFTRYNFRWPAKKRKSIQSHSKEYDNCLATLQLVKCVVFRCRMMAIHEFEIDFIHSSQHSFVTNWELKEIFSKLSFIISMGLFHYVYRRGLFRGRLRFSHFC